MEYILNDYHRNLSQEDLLSDIKRVATQLGRSTITQREYEQYGKFHPSTLHRRFGSWFNILEKCGLQPSRSKLNISERELFENLERVWTTLGRQPKYDEIKKPISEYSAGTYEHKFGSWRKALEAFVAYINAFQEQETLSPSIDLICEDDVSNDIQNSNKNNITHKTKREISDRLRFQILMRDGFTCRKCGRSPMNEFGVKLHVDHIIPWSKGGETLPDNLETKCEQCNLGKGNAFNC